jgi:Ser/Thr protein kinase RdoA (MazF antagonist)
MFGSLPPCLGVTYSMASAEAVAAFVCTHYGLPTPVRCSLLNRGFNDTYEVWDADGSHYVFRLSNARCRSVSDVAAETAFIAHLDAAGVPVTAAVATPEGARVTEAILPEGTRVGALFRYVEGRAPELDVSSDAEVQGMTLARLHDAAERFSGGQSVRLLDLDYLLHRQVETVSALDTITAETRINLSKVAHRLSTAILSLETPTWTHCHGDCHGLNARIVKNDNGQESAVFFDFDECGFGYLSYDLAVHLWAQVSFQRRRYAMWNAFIRGYRSARPIPAVDFEAIHLFVPVRHIWLMGQFAERINEWGSESLSATWLDRQVNFLMTWERERLSTGLL